MLLVNNLSKAYSGAPALRNVSLEVPTGAIFGLLGPNGAGKSTLLKLIMGFIFPDRGQIQCQAPPQRIGYLPERPSFPETTRVDDYLRTAASLAGLHGAAQRAAVEAALHTVGLGEMGGRRIRACSKGVRQRLALAQALLGDPPLLLLDEPAAGLDPESQVQMRTLLHALQQAGRTIILSTHQLGEVTLLCSHVAILSAGRVKRLGPLAQVLTSEPHVHITVSELPPALIEPLQALAPGVAIADHTITLTGPAISHKATVLRSLLDAGLDVCALTHQQANLEDIYLEAIRS